MIRDNGRAIACAGVTAVAGDQLMVTGVVDADNVLALRAEGERLIQFSQSASQSGISGQTVTVRLDDLATASSIVLSLLLSWQRAALSRHRQLVFSGVSDRLRSLAALSGLHRHLSGF